MDTHRIEGIKFDFDRLGDEELEDIRGHLLISHARLTGEIALIETTLFDRRCGQLDMALDYGRDE